MGIEGVGAVRRPGLALAAVCIGFGMITLDATIVNVALPAIEHSFGGAVRGAQWVVDSYTVALAAVLLSAGTTADRLGARAVYLAGLTVFIVASVGCAGAPSLGVLVAARAVQGLGAAGLVPPSLTLIVHMFPDPAARAKALGWWGGMSGLGLAAGPVLGGLAVSWLGWPAIFLVNVPVGVVALLLTRRVVPDTPRTPRARLDAPGQVLGILALTALTGGFIEASRAGWDAPLVVALLGGAAVLAAVFVVVERRSVAPMVPLAVFGNRRFAAASGIGFLFNFCLYGSLFCLTLYVQQARGWSALGAGLALLPNAVLIGVNAFFSGRLVARFGPRRPMLAGVSAGAAGTALLATLGDHSGWWVFFVGTVVFGCCALAMPSMTSVAMHALPAHQAGLASGLLNAARQTGGALGIAVLGSLLGTRIDLHGALAVVAAAYVLAGALAVAATWSGRARDDLARPNTSGDQSPEGVASGRKL